MKTASTQNFGFTRISLLLIIAAAGLLSGCESTTTVNDGFGMEFSESNKSQADRVNVD